MTINSSPCRARFCLRHKCADTASTSLPLQQQLLYLFLHLTVHGGGHWSSKPRASAADSASAAVAASGRRDVDDIIEKFGAKTFLARTVFKRRRRTNAVGGGREAAEAGATETTNALQLQISRA